MTDYQVGDTIEVRCAGGIRVAVVEYRDPDIKNGMPGWDGVCVSDENGGCREGDLVWGYDFNVIKVL